MDFRVNSKETYPLQWYDILFFKFSACQWMHHVLFDQFFHTFHCDNITAVQNQHQMIIRNECLSYLVETTYVGRKTAHGTELLRISCVTAHI